MRSPTPSIGKEKWNHGVESHDRGAYFGWRWASSDVSATDEAGRRRARRVSSACGIKRLALHLVAMSIRKQAADGNLKH
jgi:hypothetical protein